MFLNSFTRLTCRRMINDLVWLHSHVVKVDMFTTTSSLRNGVFALGCCAVTVMSLGVAKVAAQAHSKPVAAKPWTPPRTPDGHPDMQGVWTHGTLTPFERPTNLGTKAFYTDAEAAEVERQAVARRANPAAPRAGDVGTDNEAFVDTDYRYLRN